VLEPAGTPKSCKKLNGFAREANEFTGKATCFYVKANEVAAEATEFKPEAI
jgi:hypothetical protein